MGNCCSAKASSAVNPEEDGHLPPGEVIVGRPNVANSNPSKVTPQPDNSNDGSTLVFFERASPDATANNLVSMCKQGKYAEVNDLIKHGFDVNVKGMWSNTPLIAACQYNHESIALRLLEEEGIDIHHVNVRGGRALTYACLGGMRDVVEKLLNMGGDAVCSDVVLYNSETDKNDFITPLSAAVINGHSAIVSKIFESRPDIVDIGFSQYSKSSGPSASTRAVITGVTPLMLACKFAHIDIISFLIRHNANCSAMDSDGNNVLHYTCQSKGAESSLSALRDAGVLTPGLINAGDSSGDTPLHILCDGKKVAAVSILLKYLSSKEGKNKLRCERKSNSVADSEAISTVVQTVISHALVNVASNTMSSSLVLDSFHSLRSVNQCRNIDGKTPLHIAVKRRSVDLVDLLLLHGFDPEVKDTSGISPRDLALKLPQSSPIMGKIDACVNKRKEDLERKHQLQEQDANENFIGKKLDDEKSFNMRTETGMITPTSSLKLFPSNESKDNLDLSRLIPETPIKPSTERKKKLTGLLMSPPSRQELFKEKRKSRFKTAAVDTPKLDLIDGDKEAKPETVDFNDDNTVNKEDMQRQQELVSDMDTISGTIEPPTQDFTTPIKSTDRIPSPEYVSGAKLNTVPVFSGTKETFTVVTSAPKKPQSGSGTSAKNVLKTTILHPPPKLLFKNDIQ